MLLEQRVFLLTMVIYRYIWKYTWKLEICQHVEDSTQGKVATAARREQLLPHAGNCVSGCKGIARLRSESERRLALERPSLRMPRAVGYRGMSPPCPGLCRWSTLREKEEESCNALCGQPYCSYCYYCHLQPMRMTNCSSSRKILASG